MCLCVPLLVERGTEPSRDFAFSSTEEREVQGAELWNPACGGDPFRAGCLSKRYAVLGFAVNTSICSEADAGGGLTCPRRAQPAHASF